MGKFCSKDVESSDENVDEGEWGPDEHGHSPNNTGEVRRGILVLLTDLLKSSEIAAYTMPSQSDNAIARVESGDCTWEDVGTL